ncbi:hypothetical protein B0H10DRAFT_1939171 [Mycena sp. CBHHK59/15]|nr:hypothetical protein B0H10DRAFT_1939171 [Mycena sp. CBHHK59/15]
MEAPSEENLPTAEHKGSQSWENSRATKAAVSHPATHRRSSGPLSGLSVELGALTEPELHVALADVRQRIDRYRSSSLSAEAISLEETHLTYREAFLESAIDGYRDGYRLMRDLQRIQRVHADRDKRSARVRNSNSRTKHTDTSNNATKSQIALCNEPLPLFRIPEEQTEMDSESSPGVIHSTSETPQEQLQRTSSPKSLTEPLTDIMVDRTTRQRAALKAILETEHSSSHNNESPEGDTEESIAPVTRSNELMHFTPNQISAADLVSAGKISNYRLPTPHPKSRKLPRVLHALSDECSSDDDRSPCTKPIPQPPPAPAAQLNVRSSLPSKTSAINFSESRPRNPNYRPPTPHPRSRNLPRVLHALSDEYSSDDDHSTCTKPIPQPPPAPAAQLNVRSSLPSKTSAINFSESRPRNPNYRPSTPHPRNKKLPQVLHAMSDDEYCSDGECAVHSPGTELSRLSLAGGCELYDFESANPSADKTGPANAQLFDAMLPTQSFKVPVEGNILLSPLSILSPSGPGLFRS